MIIIILSVLNVYGIIKFDDVRDIISISNVGLIKI